MTQDNRPPFSTKDRLIFLAGLVIFCFGFYLIGISDSRMMSIGSMVVMALGGIIISNVANKHAKPDDYLKQMLDHPIQEMRKKEQTEIKERWHKYSGINEFTLLERLSDVARIKNVSGTGNPRALVIFSNGREFLVAIDRVDRLTVTYMVKTPISTDIVTDPFETFDDVVNHLSLMSAQPFSEDATWLPINIA